jgi:hypothetical protein
MFEETIKAERADRTREFWICTVLGVVTCVNLIRHGIQAFRIMTPVGFIYFALSLVATIAAWFFYYSLETGLSAVSAGIDESILSRCRKATGWLYVMVNLAVYSLMHFVPRIGHIAR